MEGIEILDIMDLVKKADERWKAMATKRKKEEEGMEAKLADAVKKEAALQAKLKEARAVVQSMEAEYIVIEAKAEAEAVQRVKKSSLTEDDVKSGKISMAEFHRRGKTARQRSELAAKQTAEEMEEALEAVRAKNKEILELELEICQKQLSIFKLSLYPGYALMKALKEQHDFVDRETAVLLYDRTVSDTNVKMKEYELQLTEGKSLGRGHVWHDLTLEEARRVAFSPMLPKRFLPELREKLKQLEGTDERMNVTLHMGLGGPRDPYISVDIAQTGKIIKTSGKIFEKKGGKIEEREPVEKTILEKH